ncbi:MAG: hypothetical protein ABJB86_22605 [Bacteroidota bacterium]
MNITRNNYEELFMLYADNELSAAQRKEVEDFIATNTDLQHELALFQQFKLKPDATVVFDNKASLLKHAADQQAVNIANYESFFVLYADNELTNEEKSGVEDFVYRHPQVQDEFELLQQVKLSPDATVVFENKEVLYRKEKDDKVIPFYWRKMAAAAAIILFVSGLFWMNREKKIDQQVVIAKSQAVQSDKQPSIQKTTDTTTDQIYKNQQPVKETFVAADAKKDNPQLKKMAVKPAVAMVPEKENKRNNNHLPEMDDKRSVPKEQLAVNTIKNTVVPPVKEQFRKDDREKPLIAAAEKIMPDQPSIILNPEENEKIKAQYASLNSNNDDVEVLNTSVNTKSSLRGFLRKASRLIGKKTNGNEDSNRKSILIGGFEIAVR